MHPDIGDNAIPERIIFQMNQLRMKMDINFIVLIICAKDNETAMVGVVLEAKCISVKALAKNGSGSYLGLSHALDYAIEMKPDLVSMSLGGPSPSPALQKRIKKLFMI